MSLSSRPDFSAQKTIEYERDESQKKQWFWRDDQGEISIGVKSRARRALVLLQMLVHDRVEHEEFL